VQLLVVGFEHGRFDGKILDELHRLRDHDVIRVIDLLLVTKRDDGSLESRQATDLDPGEAAELGALVGALVGLAAGGDEEAAAAAGAADLADAHLFGESDIRDVGEAIAPGQSAAIALIEHRWAIPLRAAVAEAGGTTLRDQWVSAADLATAGMTQAAGPAGLTV
jgi:uncharacterized membrane protein